MIFASHVEVSAKKGGFDWEPVMNAIIQIESKGNPAAVNGPYVGVLQISPVLVKECNNILKVLVATSVIRFRIALMLQSLRKCLLSFRVSTTH